jgi:hypothetical protein
MFEKLINDEQGLTGSAGGSNPLSLLGLGLTSLFGALFLFGCDLGLGEVVFEEEIPPSDHVGQLVGFGDITVNLVEGRNDTVRVQVHKSSEEKPAGLKILLAEFYKKYPDATKIKFTFTGITADTLRRFAVGLLDKESRDAEQPGLPPYNEHAVFVDLSKMISSEPYAWNNLETYKITVNDAELSIEFDLALRDIFIHNLMHVNEKTGLSNITISKIEEHSVKFSLTGSEYWSYLGLDAKQALPDGGWTLGAGGGLAFKLNGSLPEDFLYRVALENEAKETLVYYPEEHPDTTSDFIPWEYFHEDYFAGNLGAAANFTPTGALRLTFGGQDSRVTIEDKSKQLEKINIYKSHTGENNGYLHLQVEGDKNNFKAQDFLSKLRFTLGCRDSADREIYATLGLGDYYSSAPDKLAQYAVYNEAGYWDIKIPFSYASVLSLRDEELTVKNISFSAAENISASYDIKALAFNNGAVSDSEHVLPLTKKIDRTKPFVAAGLSMYSKQGTAEAEPLELLDMKVQPGSGQAFPLAYLRKGSALTSRPEALSFTVYTDTKGAEGPVSYTLQADGDIVVVY